MKTYLKKQHIEFMLIFHTIFFAHDGLHIVIKLKKDIVAVQSIEIDKDKLNKEGDRTISNSTNELLTRKIRDTKSA